MTCHTKLMLKFRDATAIIANGIRCDETLVLLQFIGGAANG